MKKLKKEALVVFSRDNLKSLVIILLIKLFTNIFLTILIFSIFYIIFPGDLFPTLPALTFAKHTAPHLFSLLFFGVLIIAFLILIPPLKIGFYLWLSETKKDNKTNLLTVFHYYSSLYLIVRTVMFELLSLARTGIVFFLYFTPTVGTFIFAYSQTYAAPKSDQLFLRLLMLASVILIFNSAILFFKHLISQIPAKFIFIMTSDKSLFSILRSSSFLLHANSKDFTKLLVSLWSVFFACLFIIPVPFAFVYMQSCIYEFTKKIIYKQNQGIVSIPLTQTVIDINI